jgi:hypothetical protein
MALRDVRNSATLPPTHTPSSRHARTRVISHLALCCCGRQDCLWPRRGASTGGRHGPYTRLLPPTPALQVAMLELDRLGLSRTSRSAAAVAKIACGPDGAPPLPGRRGGAILSALMMYDVTTLVLCFVVGFVNFVRRYNQVCGGGRVERGEGKTRQGGGRYCRRS